MNMNSITFEDVKGYLYNCDNEIMCYLNNDDHVDVPKLLNFAIEDLEGCIQGNGGKQLGDGDLDYAALLTMKIIYLVVADKFEETEKFATMWAMLFKNYLEAFHYPQYPKYPKAEFFNSLINLLELKNNMARLILLSDYIIDNRKTDSNLTVSQTYIDTILEKGINCDPPKCE